LRLRLADIGTDPTSCAVCGVVIAVATIGKMGGSTVALGICEPWWRESAPVGALMNCRGLTKLVVLTLGLTPRLRTDTVFTMLVIMALVTTMLTGPLAGVLPDLHNPCG
jgi:Kef-type K+ transport system membrane component KefB